MYNFDLIKNQALCNIHKVLGHCLPGGKWEGQEYVVPNPTRSDNRPGSFKINRNGRWADFATDDKGGDLISLVAYRRNCSQSEAAEELASLLGVPFKKSVASVKNVTRNKNLRASMVSGGARVLQIPEGGKVTSVTEQKEKWTPIIPIPDDAPPPPQNHPKGRISQQWAYNDKDGKPIFYQCRFEAIEGEPGKSFRPLTFCFSNQGDIGWKWLAPPEPRPLYNLDKILARPDKPVLICEGEKSADAASILFPDYVTTTTLNGAKSPHKTDFSCLKERVVLIWPDNDEAGKRYAEEIAQLVVDAASIDLINLEKFEYSLRISNETLLGVKRTLPNKWDAADALKEGYTFADIKLLSNVNDFRIPWKRENTLDPKGETLKSKSNIEKHSNSHYTTDSKEGVVFHRLNDDGETFVPIRLCSHMEITALTRDSLSENWGRLLKFPDRDGVSHQFPLPMELMSGDGNEYRKELLRLGLEINGGRGINTLLDNYIKTANPRVFATCTNQIGWHGSIFVLPSGSIGESAELIIYQSTTLIPHHFKQNGDIKNWQDTVAQYCIGNSRLLFSVSAAFAGPLLHLLGEESGGFNFYGPSSCGKTTALKVAASVYGDLGFLQRWRATSNGLEGLAQMHNDTLLILDELAQVDPKEAGEIAYMLANGQGKVRSNKSGFARPSATWRLLFLSAGEISLGDHMLDANKKVKTGQQIRLVDIPADAEAGLGLFENLHGFDSGADLSNALCKEASKSYGTAGRVWLETLTHLTETPGKLSAIKQIQDDFLQDVLPPNAAGQVRRVASRMGLIAAAGELATGAGITGWPTGQALWAAKTCFNAWLENRDGSGNQETAQMLSQVRAYFESHGNSQFTPWDEPKQITNNRAGFRKEVETDKNGEHSPSTEYYMLQEAYKNNICKGFNQREMNKLLLEKGWLKPDKEGKASKPIRLPGLGTNRCYVFDSAMMGDKI